ncbi:prephenate dehydrogenase [Ramlibacter sp. AW1]|uniref:Prephenate dehydrogenase n=1 Tax=Ramlibacter aurantiacus TaxID=2801330 RepID=A0A936ZN96_9BURK|nr:prephenate dehydrogenase dimerization domain-containing protein [Ramlibacter aurantiacus]MBL0419351.1 prephenate dehydrogenase [Ramlibacter aurantiacus]
MLQITVLGAAGQVAGLFISHLTTDDRVDVHRVDVRAGARVMQADVLEPHATLKQALHASDVVLNCLPDNVAAQAIAGLLGELRPGALLVDTLSVKGPYLAKLSEVVHAECLSLNPLFGPDIGFAGQSLAWVSMRGGPRTEDFRRRLHGWGARTIDMSVDEHDRTMAVMQAGVHAAVLAWGRLVTDLPPSVIAELSGTPPFQVMSLLLSRIATGNPNVYSDIQAVNGYAADARREMREVLTDLDVWSAQGDRARFARYLAELSAAFGPGLSERTRQCAAIFSALKDLDSGHQGS